MISPFTVFGNMAASYGNGKSSIIWPFEYWIMIEGSRMGVTKWPKWIFFTFFHKKPPKRLILVKESAETSWVISREVNLSMRILIKGLLTTKVFVAERIAHIIVQMALRIGKWDYTIFFYKHPLFFSSAWACLAESQFWASSVLRPVLRYVQG